MKTQGREVIVRRSIGEKLKAYYGDTPKNSEISPLRHSTYEEARDAKDVRSMISHKFLASTGMPERKRLSALSREYANLSIVEIQQRIKDASLSVEKAEEAKEQLYQTEFERLLKVCKRALGGNEDRARVKALEYMATFIREDEAYIKAENAYKDANREYTALRNAQAIYIEDNKELIEAEKTNRRRDELLASGLLDELDPTPVEAQKSNIETIKE